MSNPDRPELAIEFVRARWMAATIPSARLVELSATGHFPHVVDPDEVIAALEPLLADRPRGAR